jgi:hypothetical protein
LRFPHSGNSPIQIKNQDYTAEHGRPPQRSLCNFLMLLAATGQLCYAQGVQAAADSSNAGSVQTPAAYKIEVGDVLHIVVWAEPQLTETAVVRPDGPAGAAGAERESAFSRTYCN